MTAYYNEHDKFAAAWLRELIKAKLIADGEVDERSIVEISPSDLTGFSQFHFFAGIGGWSYALRLAGWPDDQPVWTGSCPCQPLSLAGQRQGPTDQRHLWPTFYNLIAKCKPSIIFGEQIASPLGREWLCGVRLDLEGLGYACGGADLPACCVGAPHIRQRLFWLADSENRDRRSRVREKEEGVRTNDKWRKRPLRGSQRDDDPGPWWDTDECIFSDGTRRRIEPFLEPLAHGVPARVGRLRGYGNAIVPQVAAEFIQAYCEVTSGPL